MKHGGPLRMVPATRGLVILVHIFLRISSASPQSMTMKDVSMKEMSTYTCGETTSAKSFNFVSPGYPVSVGSNNLSCSMVIDHGCPLEEKSSICQIRLDFTEFSIQPPLLGNCRFDKFYVNGNGEYPLLCGQNTGHHMYIDVEGRKNTDLTFILQDIEPALYSCPDKFGLFKADPALMLLRSDPATDRQKGHPTVSVANSESLPQATFPTRRSWKMSVTQLPCGCADTPVAKAPAGCLQYYSGISGDIKSFNYDSVGCFSNDHYCEPNALAGCDIFAGYTGQLNNQDYAVCLEQEYGFCGTEYYAAMEPGSFTLTNTTDLHMDAQDVVSPGSDNGAACGADYLLLPGGHCKNDPSHSSTDRFCGNAMGVMGIKQPIISYSKPFMFRLVTDADEITSSVDYMNRGFHLKYHQLPCSSARH